MWVKKVKRVKKPKEHIHRLPLFTFMYDNGSIWKCKCGQEFLMNVIVHMHGDRYIEWIKHESQ